MEPMVAAAVQAAYVLMDRKATLEKTVDLVRQAAAEGAGLIVFPEPRKTPTRSRPITPRYTYVEYGTGEKELYDRDNDPYELRSRHRDAAYADTMTALSDRLSTLVGCRAVGCREAEDGP